MENLKQQLAIGYKLIENVRKANLRLKTEQGENFLQSLERQLQNNKALTTAQKRTVKAMDTIGNFDRFIKKQK